MKKQTTKWNTTTLIHKNNKKNKNFTNKSMAENNNAHNPKMYTIPGKIAPAQQKYAQVQYTLETPMQT